MANHVTIGVYGNDTYKVNIVDPRDLEHHIQYNKDMRPGRGFFVDGVCVNKGYMSDKRVEEWTKKIAEMKIDTSKVSEKYW